MDDNNLFDDEDNALDYVIYEECEKEVKKTNNNKDRKSTRLNSSHIPLSRMPSSA